MAYQAATYDYGAREAHFNQSAKLVPSRYDQYNDYDDDDEEEYSEEEEDEAPWYTRSERSWAIGACLLLALIVLVGVLHAQLTSTPPAPPAPTPAPPPLPTPAPPPSVWEPPELTGPTTTTGNPLIPSEDMNDNNICEDSEELFGGLCYRTCSDLTGGYYPIRTSSWTCCAKQPCVFSNQKGQVGKSILCKGYDVGYDGNCPRQPGACLNNEEFFLGVCYKKCALLTDGRFPHRVGPASCCVTSGVGCFDIRQDATSAAFNTGGGQGDADAATPAAPHGPMTNLTEQGGAASTTGVPPPGAAGSGGIVALGTRCEADEELYAGLCYKQCGLLTSGTYPIRTSSWTCCASRPCGVTNQKGSVGSSVLCNGFDVGGQGAVNVGSLPCPHKPTGCNATQEEVLGICYESCELLTNGEFPHRLTATTCCKEAEVKACLDVAKLSMSSGYNVAR